jgi:hypothetical protein
MYNWNYFSYSSIGSSHLRKQMPCQDASKVYFDESNQVCFGCISDGAGSAKYADKASSITVRNTLSYLRSLYNTTTFKNRFDRFNDSDTTLYDSFYDLLESCYFKLFCTALRRKHFFKDYSCTLIGFIYHPEWLLTFQLGDGFIVSRSRNSADYNLHYVPYKGTYANSTVFINSNNRKELFKINLISEPIDFLCCSSDGIERLALQKNKAYNPFFKGLEKNFKSNPNSAQALIKWMDTNESLNKKTTDDKSLIIATQV